MKEVLTKSFWRGVTKTFYQALEGPPPKASAPQIPAEVTAHESKEADVKPAPEVQANTADGGPRSKAP